MQLGGIRRGSRREVLVVELVVVGFEEEGGVGRKVVGAEEGEGVARAVAAARLSKSYSLCMGMNPIYLRHRWLSIVR